MKKIRLSIILSSLCLFLGMFSGRLTEPSDYMWLSNLKQPWFSPPNWLYAPVWTIIYLMMGVAIAKIWIANKKQNNKLPIIIFIVQLILNLAWSPIFFHFRRIDLALCDLFLLWISLLILLFITKKIHRVFFLLLPYVVWVSFALVLNFSIYKLNA